jgi:capsular polysaccharide transport system permease protein
MNEEAIPEPPHVPGQLPPDPTLTLEQIRLAQAKRIGRMLTLIVLLPTLVTAVYDLFIASKQYASETTITLDAGVGSEPATVGSPLARDVMMVETFLTSRELTLALARDHALRASFANPRIDALSRLEENASDEALHAYLREHVDVDFDPERAFITVRVRAFSGEDAERIANAIVTVTRANVDRLVEERRTAALGSARRDAVESARKLGEARAALAAIPDVPTIAIDGGAPTDPDAGVLATPSVPRESARAELELTQGRAEATARALDEARAAATRLERRTVVVTRATRPDVAALPRPIRDMLTVFLGSLALLVIGSIVVSTIREHV